MNITLRKGVPEDASTLGEICWKAFTTINQHHNFPPDFPSAEVATDLLSGLLARADIYSVVAELNGKIIGSNFLWESDAIVGVGPITVDPRIQNAGVGRRLMEDVLGRADQKGFVGVRLVQAGFHTRSLSLYTKLGFVVREPLAVLQGTPLRREHPGLPVRQAVHADLPACEMLCRNVHGHARSTELRLAIEQNSATVVERHGRITGYATGIGFFGYAVAETNEDIKALIAAAAEITGPGFLVPTRNTALFTWCLKQGLRVVQPMTLMSLGLYTEPRGSFLPSILY